MSDKKPMTSLNDDDAESVRILPPSYSIKEKIGMNVNLNEIFTPERIAAAQEIINETQAEFVSWASKDLVELEHAYRHMEKEPEKTPASRIEKIRKIAFSLKCQSGTFGYPLGSDVAKSLYRYTVDHGKYNKDNIVVLRKHIDALQVIFQQNIQGEGGQMGDELMHSLEKLVDKLG
jgi:chemotaxis protein histidine kinase CheA